MVKALGSEQDRLSVGWTTMQLKDGQPQYEMAAPRLNAQGYDTRTLERKRSCPANTAQPPPGNTTVYDMAARDTGAYLASTSTRSGARPLSYAVIGASPLAYAPLGRIFRHSNHISVLCCGCGCHARVLPCTYRTPMEMRYAHGNHGNAVGNAVCADDVVWNDGEQVRGD